jgi:hypothetical protein
MLWERVARALSLGALLCLLSCSDASERNIITGKPPFFHASIPYRQAETVRVIASVHRFASANGMDFLLARDTLPAGDYNAHAAGYGLNLQAIHTQGVSPATTDIYAVSRLAPSEADKKKVREFVCSVGGLERLTLC